MIGDTGFVVALLNQADASHLNVAAVYAQHLQRFLPQTVLAEVAYLVGRNGATGAVVSFLRGLPASRFRLEPLTDQDLMRVAEILDEYADSRIDFVDATVMAVAERYGIKRILTLDRRYFMLFRPRHCQSFEILP